MKLLILGGTVFLGRHVVHAAVAAGHEITLFNRGRSNADLFPDVEKLTGDRLAGIDGLQALRGRTWDAVIDTSGYVPRVAAASAQVLGDSVAHYTFVSSISVYADMSSPGITEEAPVGTIPDPTTESITGESYGPLKALCESVVTTAMPGRTLIVRPGLLVGPHDPSGRFTYWPRRIAAGGEVMAPGAPDCQVEFIDARDGAAWMIRAIEARLTGVFNMTGPAQPLGMGAFLDACRTTLNPAAHLTWLPEAFLLANGAIPWTEVPMWIPADDGGGVLSVDIRKALQAGLAFRPIAETVRDTFEWDAAGNFVAGVQTQASAARGKAGLEPAKEAELLRAWKASEAGAPAQGPA